MTTVDISAVKQFLKGETPDAWVQAACAHQSTLLIDHAHCEKKAAATGLNLMFRYVEHADLQHKLSRLVREEMRHFEQVLALMQEREVAFKALSPSRYASHLRQGIRTHEPARLVDTLIVSAFIEARSCERFATLAPYLKDEALQRFYVHLLRSEARHFEDYLALAQCYAKEDITPRIAFFREKEADLIQSVDSGPFRFHSGAPVSL